MSGFITNSFTSAFNVFRDSLTINNVDLGVSVDNISINPNDSYTNQNTQFGSVKVLWPHLSLTGEVQLFLKYLTQAQVDAVERACKMQDTNIYVGFAGYMYRTEHIDYSYQPSSTQHKLDMTLSFYGVLPYSTPVFRPTFSTLSDGNGLVMSTNIFSTTVKGSTYALLPLPGCSVATREDVIALLTHKTDKTVGYTISSDISNYQSGTTAIMNALSNNIDQHYNQVSGLIKSTEGEDVFVSAKVVGTAIQASRYTFKYERSNASIAMTATNLPNITTSNVNSMYIKDTKLYVWTALTASYKLTSYDLVSGNKAEELIDSTKIHVAPEGVTMFPNFTHKYLAPYTYGLKDKSLLAIVNLSSDVDTYRCYKLPKSEFNAIPGVNANTMTGILHADKLEDNRLIVFPKGLSLTSTESVLYAVFSFRNYEEDREQYSDPKLIGYKIGAPLTDYSQMFITSSYIQTNTVIIAGTSMHMTTEAYTDYYKEDNILAMTLSTNQHKYYAIDLGATVQVRILTK